MAAEIPVTPYIPDAYNLLKKPEVSTVVDYGFVDYSLSRNLLDIGILEFFVDGNMDQCIVPSQTFLKVKFEISGTAQRKSSGPPPQITEVKIKRGASDGAKIGVINNFFMSAFESVQVSLSNTNLSKNDKHHPYVSFFRTLINHGGDTNSQNLALTGWAKDSPGFMNSYDKTENTALATREKCFTEGTDTLTGEFIGRICHPLFDQVKILPNLVNMRVTLNKADEKFCLMHEEGNFRLKITGALLMVQRVRLTESLRESYMKLFDEGHSIPYILRTPTVDYYTIEYGSSRFMRDDLFKGRMPLLVIAGMVDTKAYHGDPAMNPLCFDHNDVEEIVVSMNGQPFPYPRTELDLAKGMDAHAYHNLMRALDCDQLSNKNPPVTLEEFRKGSTLFCFKMSPDGMETIPAGSLTNKNVNIRLEMKFRKALTKNITLLVYSEIDNLMEIHKDRSVTVNY